MKIHEIGPPLSPKLAVFPGDKPYERTDMMSFEQGHHLKLSWFETSCHIGAHADAPNHYHPDGEGIHQRDPLMYMGLCQVVEVKPAGATVKLSDLADLKIQAPRVLFKTSSFTDPHHWNSDFKSLDHEIIPLLKDNNVCLVGIDTPSVDPETSKDLACHQAIYRANLAILEGLWLEQVNPGLYTLIAPPLRMVDADASPVRPLLIENFTGFSN